VQLYDLIVREHLHDLILRVQLYDLILRVHLHDLILRVQLYDLIVRVHLHDLVLRVHLYDLWMQRLPRQVSDLQFQRLAVMLQVLLAT